MKQSNVMAFEFAATADQSLISIDRLLRKL